MKKYLSELKELKMAYPNLELDGDSLYQEDALIATEAHKLIEEHYEGRTIPMAHPSGDPCLEEPQTVSGALFIEYEFNGNYHDALDAV